MIVTAKFGSEIVLSPNGRNVDVTALAGGGFAVGWLEQNLGITFLQALFLNPFGQVAGPEISLVSTISAAIGPELATLTGGGFAATWTLADRVVASHTPKVGGRMVSAAGVAGPSFSPADSELSEQADIAGLPNGGFVEVWHDRHTSDFGGTPKGRFYDSAGARVLSEFVINDTAGSNPAVAAAADGTFAVVCDVARNGSDQISARIFSATGVPITAEFLVNTTTSRVQDQPAIAALAGGGFIVVWRDQSLEGDNSGTSIKGRLLDPQGNLGGEFLVNTSTFLAQAAPAVAALPDGGFMVAWEDSSQNGGDISGSAIRAQTFSHEGAKVGGEFVVNTFTDSDQLAPSVAAGADGRVLVAWHDHTNVGGIRGQRYLQGNEVLGTPGDDPLVAGTAASDVMHGLAGNDTLQGFGASDVLYGEGGNDLLDGGAEDDAMEGGTGDDTYIADSLHDAVLEAPGAGYDQIRSGADAYETPANVELLVLLAGAVRGNANGAGSKIIGNGGDNVLIGGAGFGADTLLGSDGNDVLNGLGGADSLEGGTGDDTYFIDHPGDQVVEAPGGGRDLVYSTLASTTLGPNLEGLALIFGAVVGIGNELANDIAGHSGDNLLDGGGGADVINGLGGIDTVTYAAFAGPVSVNLAAGTGFDGVSTDTLLDIENLIGTSLADTLVGDALGNMLDGGAGNDTITGGGGWDVLIGGSGADLLQGDDGFDYASYETAAAGVVASLADKAGSTGDARGDVYAGIEGLTGSAFADLLIGDAAGDHLKGGAGNDTLQGSAGTDALDGGAGIDTASYAGLANAAIIDLNANSVWKGSEGDSLVSIENAIGSGFDDTIFGTTGDNVLDGGPGGSDQINGYTGSDTVSYASLGKGVIIDLNAGATSAVGEGDSLTSIENAIGSAFADTIFGTTGDNVLDGGSGGADWINGYTGSDTVSYASLGRGVIIDLNAGGSWEGAEGDTLISIENAIGSRFNDTIFGTTGDNVLDGGTGADSINGYLGTDTVSYARSARAVVIDLAAGTGADGIETDTLISIENAVGSGFDDRFIGTAADNLFTGGGGHNTFVFAAGFGHDTIADFHAGPGPGDVIEFHGVFESFAEVMTNATQSGSDVVIEVDSDSSLRLKDISLAAFFFDDFLYL